jgi:hypothetical protein
MKRRLPVFVCELCGLEVDPAGPDTAHRVTGWELPSHVRASGSHGGSDIVLRERVFGLAHRSCLELEKRGISLRQEALL